jgi:hypothetical protein
MWEFENGVLPPCRLPDPPVVYRSRLRGGSESMGYLRGRPLLRGAVTGVVSVIGAIFATRIQAIPKAPIVCIQHCQSNGFA